MIPLHFKCKPGYFVRYPGESDLYLYWEDENDEICILQNLNLN